MDSTSQNRKILKLKKLEILVLRIFAFLILLLLLRFAYLAVSVNGDVKQQFLAKNGGTHDDEDTDGFVSLQDLWTSKKWRKSVDYYTSIFQDLFSEGYLTTHSKSLCVETLTGEEVFALRELGVDDSFGSAKKEFPPLVVSREGNAHQPFDDNTFDFVFSGGNGLDRSFRPSDFAADINRILKPGGYFVVLTRAKDRYSFSSFLELFDFFRLVRSQYISGPDSTIIHAITMRKERIGVLSPVKSDDKCYFPEYKRELISNVEPLIEEEPLKPWIALKRNIMNVKYLSSMVELKFKRRYVYIDVGARSYRSSIGSWFKKQYPKQNKTFEIYAIEADKTFHDEYKMKKGITLLPYAAWIKNETLFFGISREPNKRSQERNKGMGQFQPVQSSFNFLGEVDGIQGLDFADWLKSVVTKKDFVVIKMDVEGNEFHLIPRLIETGAICLVDEIFLECHYNRWQQCCPGVRSLKYQKTYSQCLNMFTSLRESGVFVHQWW